MPLRIKVVSSAYWLILTSNLFTEIPLIALLDLIALARISADSINRYGERGQPCPGYSLRIAVAGEQCEVTGELL